MPSKEYRELYLRMQQARQHMNDHKGPVDVEYRRREAVYQVALDTVKRHPDSGCEDK